MILLAASAGAQSPPNSPVPPDSEIRKILVERIDTFHQGVGIVVGVIEPQGRRVVAYGSLNQGDPRPLNGDTIFEIGSVTKVFTSLLLSDMVQRGEVALADPVAKYLPRDVKVPERGGRVITLGGPVHPHFRPSAVALQPSAQGSRQSVCGLHGGATLSIPLVLSTDARHRLAV